jgi:hypothetical protein
MLLVALAIGFKTLATGQWTTSNGSKVSLIFVLPAKKQAWRPDGSAVDLRTLPRPVKPLWTGRETEPIALTLVLPAKPQVVDPTVRFKLPSTTDLDASFATRAVNGKIWYSEMRLPFGQPAQQDIAVGISAEPWQVSSWIAFAKAGKTVHAIAHGGKPTRIEVTGANPGHAGPLTMVATPTPLLNTPKAYRIIVRDTYGKNLLQLNSSPIEGREGWTNFTFGGDFSTVSRVELVSRKLDWHTIRAAHFKAPVGISPFR